MSRWQFKFISTYSQIKTPGCMHAHSRRDKRPFQSTTRTMQCCRAEYEFPIAESTVWQREQSVGLHLHFPEDWFWGTRTSLSLHPGRFSCFTGSLATNLKNFLSITVWKLWILNYPPCSRSLVFSTALLCFNHTHCSRLKAEAGRTQLSSPNPGIKEIHKSVRQHCSPCSMLFGK